MAGFHNSPEVPIPDADQKDRGLWGRDCEEGEGVSRPTKIYAICFLTNCSKEPEEESEELSMTLSGDVSADSRLAVTANFDRTLKFYSFPGV